MINANYFLACFLMISICLCASDLENNSHTSQQPSPFLSRKAQSCIYYSLSVISGLSTIGFGYYAYSDSIGSTSRHYDPNHGSRLVTECFATFFYACTSLFTGYQGFKVNRQQDQYQSLN
jgi:hypothetical protein